MDSWQGMLIVILAIVSSHFLAEASSTVSLADGCAQTTLGDGASKEPNIPPMSWIQTPSLMEIGLGSYRVLGRIVHLKYVKEQLQNEQRHNFDFSPKRKNIRLISRVEILTDTLYIEDSVKLHGIKELKVFARRIVASAGSQLDVSAPNWDQEYKTRISRPGQHGENGNKGIDGPTVEIFVDVIRGSLDVIANGGNGHKGQDGGNGKDEGGLGKKPDKTSKACTNQKVADTGCKYVYGTRGDKGRTGGDGGNAGKPGNGGRAGSIKVRWNRIRGRVVLKSCKGMGAEPAKNGRGGKGGAGSKGGLGRKCKVEESPIPLHLVCFDDGAWRDGKGKDGDRGDDGKDGTTSNSKGRDGAVSKGVINQGTLNKYNKKRFPVELLKIMKRQAEDLLLADPTSRFGKNALEFIKSVVEERTDDGIDLLKKEVVRKLGFLGKKGFDIFGRNKMFAPRMKWDALKNIAQNKKIAAKEYEEAFNGIKASVENKGEFEQLARKMASLAEKQITAERKRLEESRNIAQSEKRLYVKSIEQLERQMTDIFKQIETTLPDVLQKAKTNENQFLAILQGVTGFVSAGASKNPFDAIQSIIDLRGTQIGQDCLKTLDQYLESIRKWLTFGKNYKALENSSDLDFDRLDVDSVPEVMQVNLEMNKEKLIAELVCLLEVTSREQDVADFKKEIESYVIAGAARIDLIAKIIDLDNEIGGYNFDIPLLKDTEQTIKEAGKPADTPIIKSLRLEFTENLLSTYREMEQSFMMNVYELYKAFKFRTLWEGDDPLRDFQRVASESAQGTGQLNGIVQLTNVLQKMEDVETAAVRCFTNNPYTTNIQKWSFDKDSNKQLFDGVKKGYTRFNIKLDQSCPKCYNIRLLQLYVELTGDAQQPDNVPADVHIQIRHLSASYFRAGDGKVKQYRQPLGAYRKLKFDRFAISDERKCQEKKKDGNPNVSFCVNINDNRWHSMCSQPLSKSSCRDSLLGAEECKSPFGTYEMKIPVDKNLKCTNTGITDKNCKDLDLTKFTKMNVWVYFVYWSGQYPTGKDDNICRRPQEKRQQITLPSEGNPCNSTLTTTE